MVEAGIVALHEGTEVVDMVDGKDRFLGRGTSRQRMRIGTMNPMGRVIEIARPFEAHGETRWVFPTYSWPSHHA